MPYTFPVQNYVPRTDIPLTLKAAVTSRRGTACRARRSAGEDRVHQ